MVGHIGVLTRFGAVTQDTGQGERLSMLSYRSCRTSVHLWRRNHRPSLPYPRDREKIVVKRISRRQAAWRGMWWSWQCLSGVSPARGLPKALPELVHYALPKSELCW
jgi:hypothetical protein